MVDDWKFIIRGFFVAALGASALMTYIVGLTSAFVGRYELCLAMITTAVVLGGSFHLTIDRFLASLEERKLGSPKSEHTRSVTTISAKRDQSK